MVQAPGRLVIRTYAPLRRYFILGGVAVLGVLLLYVAYEWGRGGSDPQGIAAAREKARLEAQLAGAEASNRELRLKLAAQETAQVAQRREREEVSRSIGELQAQVARQAQDLAFYRGIVGDNSQAPPVRVQQFRVAALGTPGRFQLRLVLGRPVRPEDVVNGTVGITIEGAQGEKPASLELAAVTPNQLRELRFNYRYLQTFEQELVLPEGFRPERATLDVRVARKGVAPVRQTFLWSLDST
jgi:hypothetical protein